VKATIWHNPKCGTSRTVLAALQARSDLDLSVVEYLVDPPDQAKLAQLGPTISGTRNR
jgi:arsenate reductase